MYSAWKSQQQYSMSYIRMSWRQLSTVSGEDNINVLALANFDSCHAADTSCHSFGATTSRLFTMVAELQRILVRAGIVFGALALFLSHFARGPSLVENFARSSPSAPFPRGEHKHEVQIFSREPLILYIKDFMNEAEIVHVLKAR